MPLSDEEKRTIYWELVHAIEKLEKDEFIYPVVPNGIMQTDCNVVCKVLRKYNLCECKNDRVTD